MDGRGLDGDAREDWSLKRNTGLLREVQVEIKGIVHQMYDCVSDVLLYLEKMSGIVFTDQTAQIWPKNEKNVF